MNSNMQSFMTKMNIDKNLYRLARSNLIFAIVLTAINLLLSIFGANLYLLFSIYVPMSFMSSGIILSGAASDEFYESYLELTGTEYPVIGELALYVAFFMALAVIGVYLLMWIFSKKKYGFMVAAAALFGIDTLLLLLGGFENILDIVIHIIIIVSLIRGCVAGKRYFAAEKYLSYMAANGGFNTEPPTPQNVEFPSYQNPENTYFGNEQSYAPPSDTEKDDGDSSSDSKDE